VNTLLVAPDLLELDKISLSLEAIILIVKTVQQAASCPRCQTPSRQIHSRYIRKVADLPWAGNAAQLELHTRKFFCRNANCQQKIFCEPLPGYIERYARQTRRFSEALALIGLALGGEAGARIAIHLGLGVSPDTLLNRIRQTSRERQTEAKVKVLGVDDFAFRRSHRYGTILVDLERREPIDCLPDREASTLEQWLKAHPGIEIVSRDRSTSYAEGITKGAPDAIQVADRWHLLKNLSEALERLLTRRSQSLQQATEIVNQQEGGGERIKVGIEGMSMLSSHSLQQITRNREKRQARYQEVHELARRGGTILGIAKQLKMSRVTVRKYLSSPTYPERANTAARGSQLDSYLPFIHKRWVEGCQNARQLWREVRERGYTGKEAMVRRYTKRLRKLVSRPDLSERPATLKLTESFRRPSTKRVTWWLLEEEKQEKLTAEEQGFVKEICHSDPEIERAQNLACSFQRIVRRKSAEELEEWIAQAQQSNLAELKGFAEGLKKDREAVSAALKHRWSNGQVEGQINRLKMIKRTMFGRGNLDLLKARVLYSP
jgi:transposase